MTSDDASWGREALSYLGVRGMVGVRKLLSCVLLLVMATAGLTVLSVPAQAADTGKSAPQAGKIVNDEPGKNAPNILDGTTYSIAKVGNTIVVGGQFTQAQNYNTSTTLTRYNLLAFDATTGRLSSTFTPDPLGIVYKVLPAADGQSVYVAGSFTSAAGMSMPGRLFKVNVTTGVVDPTFVAPAISGDVRDLELVGNHLFLSGKFTHINGVAQKALGTVFADTGKRDPYFNAAISGVRNSLAGALTNILQISINPQNTELMAVGNFTTIDGQARSQIARFDIGNVPNGPNTTVHQSLSSWSTNLYTSACAERFDTYMTDVEYSTDGSYFVVSTTGAYGGAGASNAGTSGCDVVARFEDEAAPSSTASWTAYTGSDSTWTVEVTDDVVYVGGHQKYQNNPGGNNVAGPGAVSREGIAALNPVNGLPFSWNPTRARGVGVQDMLATTDGLYVGSDTTLIGHTAGNTFHARIAVLPLAGGATVPAVAATTLPVDLYKVASGASQLQTRSFTGTTAGTASNAPTGPGWGTTTGAFMVNGVLYKVNSDGTVSKMTFTGSSYGTSSAVASADALAAQTDWHTDAKTLTSLFYANGRIYYTKSGTNALYRRGFEIEDDVVGQQRFATTTSALNWSTVRGAFVVGNKLYYATTTGSLFSATWDQRAHNVVAGTVTQLTAAGTGWASRALFPLHSSATPVNNPPVAAASVSCDQLSCSFDGTASTDPENGPLTYDWNFGDGTAHGAGATTTHTYATGGDRAVTLTVTDNKGASASTTRTANAIDHPDTITFVNSANNNGSRSNHTIAVPSGAKAGDTLLLFFTGNSTGPVYAGPAGWTRVLNETGSSSVGQLYSKTATASDLGANVTVTSRTTANAAYTVKSDLTLAAYRGLGTPAITASASTSQNVAATVHQTPTVNAPDGASWLVSFWSDKTSTGTGWTGPADQTKRSQGTATDSSHVSSLLMDSNKRVSSGPRGGLIATADSSATGLTMSVLLAGGTPAAANQDPVAQASLVGCTDLVCSFDGGSSSDPEGGNLTYDWNWGDGTAHGTTATPSHTFAGGGDTQVTLTVTDPQGATGTTTVTATPEDPPPNTAPTARITDAGCTGLSCSFDGSTSSDPDTDALTYSWAFGDGATATTANPTHAYGSADGAPYTVTLTVSDGHGHTATDSTTVSPIEPPNTAPTAHITGVSCPGLTCSFNGTTSTDPENDPLTYSWDFGDGSPAVSGGTPSHTYADATPQLVTLTVSDNHAHSATDTATATPNPDPVSTITFVGSAQTAGNRQTHTVTLPTGVKAGDTMVLFLGAASIAPTYTGPNGWTQIESKDGSSAMVLRAWTRTATQADTVANTKVTVTSSASAKSDLSLSVYRGTDPTTPIAVSASKIDNSAGAAHTSPTVAATGGTSWLVSYWADRSNTSTAWTAPSGPNAPTVRQPGIASDTGSAHAIGLLADSNGPVAAGTRGGLTATANGDSSRGASVSILLKSS